MPDFNMQQKNLLKLAHEWYKRTIDSLFTLDKSVRRRFDQVIKTSLTSVITNKLLFSWEFRVEISIINALKRKLNIHIANTDLTND